MTAAPIRDDARILSHLPRVRTLALHLAARTGGNVEADELVGAGTVGLLDAATRFDESKGIPFDAFVHARVHGAMLDAMRADDHLGRSARRRERLANSESQSLPRHLAVVPLEAAGELAAEQPTPGEEVERAQAFAQLREAIRQLAEREQLVLSLYYERELTYREIGVVLGVSESRICQVLRELQKNLRDQLSDR